MKKIFIQVPYPVSDESEELAGLCDWVKEQTGLPIIIHSYDWEEDNQPGYFEVEESDADTVVSAIYEYGDTACFDGEPVFELNNEGNVCGYPNMIA